MSDQVYKTIELVGTSSSSIEEAVQSAVKRASKTVRSMQWFEVKDIRGQINEGAVDQWQVILKIGFSLEDKA